MASVPVPDVLNSPGVTQLGCLNAAPETGFSNPIDEALRRECALDVGESRKLDEIPYDFGRKRLTILVAGKQGGLMVTKGALDKVLEVCTQAEVSEGKWLAWTPRPRSSSAYSGKRAGGDFGCSGGPTGARKEKIP